MDHPFNVHWTLKLECPVLLYSTFPCYVHGGIEELLHPKILNPTVRSRKHLKEIVGSRPTPLLTVYTRHKLDKRRTPLELLIDTGEILSTLSVHPHRRRSYDGMPLSIWTRSVTLYLVYDFIARACSSDWEWELRRLPDVRPERDTVHSSQFVKAKSRCLLWCDSMKFLYINWSVLKQISIVLLTPLDEHWMLERWSSWLTQA